MANSRKENFIVTLKPDKRSGNNEMSITHNGYQWVSLDMTYEELAKLRDKITTYLEGNN